MDILGQFLQKSHLTAAKGKMRVAYADPGCELLEGIAMHQIRGNEHGGRASDAGHAVRDHGFVSRQGGKKRLGKGVDLVAAWWCDVLHWHVVELESVTQLGMIEGLFKEGDQYHDIVL